MEGLTRLSGLQEREHVEGRVRDDLTSRKTHVQPCRKTGRREGGQWGGRGVRLDGQGGAGQRPPAPRDIAASLNSIMTVSSTSQGPAWCGPGGKSPQSRSLMPFQWQNSGAASLKSKYLGKV